jgi:potassium channel subfamily K
MHYQSSFYVGSGSGGFDLKSASRGNTEGIREVRGQKAQELLRKVETKKHIRRRDVALKCFFIVLLYTGIGWSTFSPIFGWTMVDSFYFAMVTVTTVGYGDIIPENDPGQQMFTACYAFLGVAFLTAIVREVVIKAFEIINKVLLRARLEAMHESRLLLEHHVRLKRGTLLPGGENNGSVHLPGNAARMGQWLYTNYRIYKRKGGALVDLLLVIMQLVLVWFTGAMILWITEGFTLIQSFYCAVITSLSVGYGDYYPGTQTGRLAFAFYIPVSVSVVLGCVGQLVGVMKNYFTVHAITRAPMTKIFELDTNKDGQVSEAEYVMFMLAETREVDPLLLDGLRAQFRALDQDKSGGLSEADFPEMLEVETTTVVYRSQIESVAWKVVPKENVIEKHAQRISAFVPMEGHAHCVGAPQATAEKTNQHVPPRSTVASTSSFIPLEVSGGHGNAPKESASSNPVQWVGVVAESAQMKAAPKQSQVPATTTRQSQVTTTNTGPTSVHTTDLNVGGLSDHPGARMWV